jgi:ATP/maltotriose-dependent transcriptional regulator MalT
MRGTKPESDQRTILRVIVVSPSDVQAERDALPRIIEEINRGVARSCGVYLQPWRWETDAFPGFHPAGPQGLIDEVMDIEDSDVVVGIFWKRFGTPTSDVKSGTEYELRRALESWTKNKRPQVMVYFSQEPYFPESSAELEQWKSVMDFKEDISQKGLCWPYRQDEFESLVRNHLQSFVISRYGTKTSPPSDDLRGSDLGAGFFDPPRFGDDVTRSTLIQELDELVESNPLVAVEGLPGSGKTYLVASYLQSNITRYESTIWYDTQGGETLDDFLTHIETQIPLTGFSTTAKCKELLHRISEQRVLLVIDDFHQVDQESYATLIDMAARYGNPARVILISRIYVDVAASIPQMEHLEIRGFTLEEMRRFLQSRNLRRMDTTIVKKLMDKTEGLPLAASLFATLVHRFGRNPNELLGGTKLTSTRLRDWFDSVSSLIGDAETKLLHVLAVSDGPFNIGSVRMLCRQERIENPDAVFENLQRAYLVQTYSPYRWSIHQLISKFCLRELSEERKREIHLAFARYHLRGLSLDYNVVFDEESLVSLVAACKQLHQAQEYKKAEEILQAIAKTVKTRGYYDLYIQLCATQLANNTDRDTWIDYHYAHCCFIIGRLQESMEIIERLVYAITEKNTSKYLAAARLYAEILANSGKPQLALERLDETLSIVGADLVAATAFNHVQGTRAGLLIKLGQHGEAEELCKRLWDRAVQNKDKRGGAVALTHWGISCLFVEQVEAAFEKLNLAVTLFRESEDRRGLAWSLTHLAICQSRMDDRAGAVRSIREGLQIKSDIGECSSDYLQLLEQLRTEFSKNKVKRLIDAELRRVKAMLPSMI